MREFALRETAKDIEAFANFAREHNVTYVIISHPNPSWWEELLQSNVVDRFIKEVGDIDIQIVS